MNQPCGIIKDLLPLYIDEVCSAESRQAVEAHTAECSECASCLEAMRTVKGEAVSAAQAADADMAGSLRRVKDRMDRRARNIMLCTAGAVLAVMIALHLMFNAVIMEVPPSAVTVSAKVYSFAELLQNPPEQVPDTTSMTVFGDEDGESETVEVRVPDFGIVELDGETMEQHPHITVMSFGSEYFLRNISYEEIREGTLYINAFKTTVFNNRAQEYQKHSTHIEFDEINRIVYLDNGTETELWSRY